MSTTHECEYCGTTQGLRISWDGRFAGKGISFVCAECFTGTDTGPCFDDLPIYFDEEARKAHLARIDDLATCCGNPDHLSAENAARALNEGNAAFWFKGRFSASALVVSAAGYEGSLTRTMIAYIDQDNEKVRQGLKSASDIDAVLDGIVPLNDAAIEELALLYRYQSTFREDLADRERAAIFSPWFVPGMDAATRAVWEVRYAACQRRFEERRAEALPDAQNAVLGLAIAAAAIEQVA